MHDVVVIKNLQARGFDFMNTSEILRYEAMEVKPRILDKAPKRISISHAKETPVFGCKQELIVVFNELAKEISGDVFTLKLNNIVRYCDREVFIVLQALIRHGISYNKEISTACYDMFRIICTSNYDTLTVERVYNVLNKVRHEGYFSKQVLDGVKFCLFGENPLSLYWKSIADFNGMYPTAYRKGCDYVAEFCQTEKDIDRMLKKSAREAKADEDFMKSNYTAGISNEMLAMIYILRDDEDCLNPDDPED